MFGVEAALATVSWSFIYLIVAVIVALFVVGFGVGMFAVLRLIGAAGRNVFSAKRKGAPQLLHSGRDGIWRLWPVKRTFGGTWRTKELAVIPEDRSVRSVAGGGSTPIAMVSSKASTTIDAEFLFFADRYTENFVNSTADYKTLDPKKIAERLSMIAERQDKIRFILEAVNQITRQEISIDEAVEKEARRKNLQPGDAVGRKNIENEITAAIKDSGASYRAELESLRIESQVHFKQGGWLINYETHRTKKGIVSMLRGIVAPVAVSLMNFDWYAPTSGGVDDLFTGLAESSAAAIDEMSENRHANLLQIGSIAILLISFAVGAYIVIQALGIKI